MRVHRAIGAALTVVATLIVVGHVTAAPPANFAEHKIVRFTDPGYIEPCDRNAGALTVGGVETSHLADTGQTFSATSTLRGAFRIDFADPAVDDVQGHFVSVHHEFVNHARLRDHLFTDKVHAVALSADVTRQPVHTMMTVLFTAGGGVEVRIHSTRCGDRPIW